jgi:tetratricopeptide (TPR) repeat protein
MTLPAVLLVLDVYPLRRLPRSSLKEAWNLLAEKAPYLFLSLLAMGVALGTRSATADLMPLAGHGVLARLAQFSDALCYYLGKTALPFRLLPLYEFPETFDPHKLVYLLRSLTVAALPAALFLARRRWPAALAAWAAYVIIITPVSGFAQAGGQWVAERYTYLSCLGWPLLAGGGLLAARQRLSEGRFRLIAAACGALLLGLSALTWRQCQVWHDSEVLWRYVLRIDPGSATARVGLGNDLAKRKRFEEALPLLREAVKLKPQFAPGYYGLGFALAAQGNTEEALENFSTAIARNAFYPDPYNAIGSLLAQSGKSSEALPYFEKTLSLRSDHAGAHANLGVALTDLGRREEAIAHYRAAIDIDPEQIDARYNLAALLAMKGDLAGAAENYRAVLKLKPDHAEANNNLGLILARAGDLEGACARYRTALQARPDFLPARANLAVALARQGKKGEAAAELGVVMRASPAYFG